MEKIVYGFIGPKFAGKSTAAHHLARKLGVMPYEISDPLKDMFVRKHGRMPERGELILLGREVAAKEGAEYLARVLLEKMEYVGVIAGMRQLEQIDYLHEHARFIPISVHADPEVRFQRAVELGKIEETSSLQQFIRDELEENRGPVQQVFACMSRALYHITNEGSETHLLQEVDKIRHRARE